MLQRLLQAFERIMMQPYWRLIRGQTLGVRERGGNEAKPERAKRYLEPRARSAHNFETR
jgi:hypothetical protein